MEMNNHFLRFKTTGAKAVLLWFTAIFIILFVCSLDTLSFYSIGIGIMLSAMLLILCNAHISFKDAKKVTGYNKLMKLLNWEEDCE